MLIQMMLRRFNYQSPEGDPPGGGGNPPADPPANPPTGDPPANPPSDPPTNPPADPKGGDPWGGLKETYAKGDEKVLGRLNRYATPGDAINALFSLQNRISSGELRSALPKDASPEQVSKWREENGIPESPDKYDLGDFKVPEEDKERIGSFLKTIHGENVNSKQAQSSIKWYYEEIGRQTQARIDADTQLGQRGMEALHAEWGNEYRPNMNMVNGLLDTMPAEVKEHFTRGRLGTGDPIMSNPSVIKWLNGISRQINPVTTVVPNAGANIASAIDDEIKEIETLMKTDRKAYNADAKKQARLQELYGARERVKG